MKFPQFLLFFIFCFLYTSAFGDAGGNNQGPSTQTEWIIIISAIVIMVALISVTIYHSVKNGHWIADVIKHNFAAIIGLPLAAIASLCLVILFEISSGPIEFSGLGFSFKGASGPIVLWCMCFITISLGIKAVWQK